MTEFAGLRLLVVEDEIIVAMALESLLCELGCAIAGRAQDVAGALALAGPDLDGAFLDVSLDGEAVYPVADALARRGVPFVFVTGLEEGELDRRFAGVPVLRKPYGSDAVRQAVRAFANPQAPAAAAPQA